MNDEELQLTQQFAFVRSGLVRRGQRMSALRARRANGTITPKEEGELRAIRAELRTGRRMFASVVDKLNIVLRTQRVQAPNLRTIRAIQGSLRGYGAGVVALHYVVVEDAVHIILTTPEVQLAAVTKVSRDTLNQWINEARTELRDPDGFANDAMERLYEALVKPVESDLIAANTKTLLLSLDGTLRYLPFAALYDGERYLVERFEVVRLTEATRDKLAKAGDTKLRVAGLGVSQEWPPFSPLPAVPTELDSIVRTSKGDPRGVVDGVIHLDSAFDAERLQEVLDQQFSVIHLASHFHFEPGTYRDSYLLLGDGKKLSVEDLRFDYALSDVELLTLSACNTGVSSTDSKGVEVEGLGAMAQNLGASSVLATLWAVDDESTGLLMSRFYRARQQGLSKATALRRAQLSLIQTTARGAKDFSTSHHWASVVLMGNWM